MLKVLLAFLQNRPLKGTIFFHIKKRPKMTICPNHLISVKQFKKCQIATITYKLVLNINKYLNIIVLNLLKSIMINYT